MPIARFPGLVIDCPDPAVLAHFYAALLEWSVDVEDDGSWADARSSDGQVISFQQIDDYQPPDWPDPQRPQQMHIDVQVEDLDVAEEATVALGAVKSEVQPGTSFRVFLDPAGHPFCLCLD